MPTGILGVAAAGLRTSTQGAVAASGQSTKGAFAYQAILGAAFPLARSRLAWRSRPNIASSAPPDTAIYGGTAIAVSSRPARRATGPSRRRTAFRSGSSYNHSILVGLRYNFGVAPPPPPPPAAVPAQAPARSYLVFFDWDKATLTDRARQIIAEAAANSTKVQYTRIEVNGYTDTSGTPKYNQGLSVRRAHAVQAELVKDGVPQNAITIQGFGDTHLLVPTGPGVREPQNRRVEIIIR